MNTYSIMGYSFCGNKKLFHFDGNKLPYRKLEDGYLYITPLQTMCKTFDNGKSAFLWAKENCRISNHFVIKKIRSENWHYNFFTKPYVMKQQYNN